MGALWLPFGTLGHNSGIFGLHLAPFWPSIVPFDTFQLVTISAPKQIFRQPISRITRLSPFVTQTSAIFRMQTDFPRPRATGVQTVAGLYLFKTLTFRGLSF